ncbi:MAG: flagellar hook-basal body complex protein FliE [Sphingomonas sp.]
MKIDASSLMAARSAILQRNEALQKASGIAPGGATGGTAPGGFTDALSGALKQVNGLQDKASTAATAYEKGETTDIAAVMLSRETASVGFQATLQVRNKLLSAYKDIMSMPV